MERSLGIIRTADTLTARQVRQNRTVDFEDCGAVLDAFAETDNLWYEFANSPLVSSQHSALLADWDALSSAGVPDAEAVQRVLAQTVLGQAASSAVPLPAMQAQPVPVKPTAAHPRAYSGTKYKPPKLKSSTAQDWRPLLCDPRSLETVAAEVRLPDTFRVSLYPLVKGQDTEIADLLALYWALGLNNNAERRAAAAYLFSLQSTHNSCNWCRLVVSLPPQHWTLLLTLVIESDAYVIQVPPSFDALLAEVLDGKDAPYRAYWLLHGLAREISPEYLLAGYRLADVCEVSYKFHAVRRSGDFPLSAVVSWGEYCQGVEDYYAGILLSFWEQCGLRDGLGEWLENTDFTQMTPDAASYWLRLLESPYWNDWGDLPDAEANAKWTAAQPWLEPMTTLLQEVPPAYQDKCLQHLKEYISQCDTQEEMQTHLPTAFTLTRRLCGPPFAEENDSIGAIADFLTNLSSPLRERFLSAPDTSFKRLEQACRRGNDTRLIEGGTEAVTRYQAEFSVRCFENDPVRFFHAAKLLGILPAPMRDTVAQAFTVLPDETPRVALARLEDAVTAALASGFPPNIRPHAEIHALQMQQLIRDNRKALRKFLAAHWEGRTDYRQTHPLTRRWLAAHPTLNLETWQTGIAVETEHATRGPLTLAIERNPLEALKLGTYVGSCLGLGGAFTHSAAAVVLDINKQVVYARDKRGTVVGRQLVAVSEADHLVCYEVYPLSAQKDLGTAFREFDMQLASALGLPIYSREETEDYDIAHILSHDWWDDGAWDAANDDKPPLLSAK